MVHEARRRRRHGGVAARTALVHRHVRHHRAVLSGLHAVGAAGRPAAGAGGRGDHGRPARLRTPRRGAPGRSRSTTSSAGATWWPTRRSRPLQRLAASGRAAAAGSSAATWAAAGQRRARHCSGAGSPWYESWLEHPDADDPFWEPLRMTAALDRCEVPVLLLSGWQDLFLDQTIDAVPASARPRRRRGDDHRAVDPRHMVDQGGRRRGRRDAGVARRSPGRAADAAAAEPGARLTSTSHGWVDLPDWPPATGEARAVPAAGGRLAADAATGRRRRRRPSAIDPADPTPTIGGRLLSRDGGYRDDTALANAPTSSASPASRWPPTCTSSATPVVELAHESDNPHNDLFVRISEVDARGPLPQRQRRIPPACAAPDPAPSASNSTRSPTGSAPGSRIRVLVAGGSHPRFARNLGTGEPPITGTTDASRDAHRAPRRGRRRG